MRRVRVRGRSRGGDNPPPVAPSIFRQQRPCALSAETKRMCSASVQRSRCFVAVYGLRGFAGGGEGAAAVAAPDAPPASINSWVAAASPAGAGAASGPATGIAWGVWACGSKSGRSWPPVFWTRVARPPDPRAPADAGVRLARAREGGVAGECGAVGGGGGGRTTAWLGARPAQRPAGRCRRPPGRRSIHPVDSPRGPARARRPTLGQGPRRGRGDWVRPAPNSRTPRTLATTRTCRATQKRAIEGTPCGAGAGKGGRRAARARVSL